MWLYVPVVSVYYGKSISQFVYNRFISQYMQKHRAAYSPRHAACSIF